MAVLKSTYQASNFSQNAITYEITVSVDEEVTDLTVDLVLPNNGTRYKTISGIGFIPTGSGATIYSDTTMYICTFNAERGVMNDITGYLEGKWKILAKPLFKA